jgi:hypothetical protein
VLDSTQSLESDTPKAQIEDVLFALGSVASHVGEVTGVLLVLVQLLARDRLISMVDAKKLIGLLSAGSPEVRRHVNAQWPPAQAKVYSPVKSQPISSRHG